MNNREIFFEQVFDKYSSMVYRLAFSRTNNRYDADDILQTVFLKLVKAEVDFTEDEHIKAWLIRVTLNTSKNLLSSAFRRLTLPLEDTLATEMESKSEVYHAVMKLSAKYRTVIHLYYFEGYNVAEIAKLLETKEATVKTWLNRARAKLGAELEGEDFGV